MVWTLTIPQKNVSGAKYNLAFLVQPLVGRGMTFGCVPISRLVASVFVSVLFDPWRHARCLQEKASRDNNSNRDQIDRQRSGKVHYSYQCIPAWTMSGRDVRLCNVALANPINLVASSLLPTWLALFSALLAFGVMTIGRSFSSNTYCKAFAFLFEANAPALFLFHQKRVLFPPYLSYMRPT